MRGRTIRVRSIHRADCRPKITSQANLWNFRRMHSQLEALGNSAQSQLILATQVTESFVETNGRYFLLYIGRNCSLP